MAGTEKISHSDLLKLLHYNPETGQFLWLVNASTRARVGSVAGCAGGGGYQQLKVGGRVYLGHRLAWFYVHGEWPFSQIDHVDRDRSNNRIANLRQASVSQNAANRLGAPPVSGAKGVRRRANNRWRAEIEHQGKHHSLGTFASRGAAANAYLAAAQKIHGQFARAV